MRKCAANRRQGDNPADTNVYWQFESSDAMQAQSRRRAFSQFLREHGTPDSDYCAAEMIYGELVANVVRHAPGSIRVRVEWGGAAPTLHVHDRGAGFRWEPALPNDPFVESSRGLYIVQRLSSDVRVRPSRDNGTRVSALLPIRRRLSREVLR